MLRTVIAMFGCYSFCTFLVNLGFLCSVFTIGVDPFETTQNGGHVCNLKIVHNHEMTWIKALCSKTMHQKSSL